MSCGMFTTWHGLLFRLWGNCGRGTPATDSLVINTDSQVLTSGSTKSNLLHDQVETSMLTSLYLCVLGVAWMASLCPHWLMCEHDVESNCCTERCTCQGDGVIFGKAIALYGICHCCII